MKTSTKVTLFAVFVFGAFALFRDKKENNPDDKLVSQWNTMCKIAKNNIKSPARGVAKISGFLAKNTSHMLKNFGDLLVTIETIKDDTDHDHRAEQARTKFQGHTKRCGSTWALFFEAIEHNDEASQLVENGSFRISRTIEILFGNGQQSWLPSDFKKYIRP